MIKTLAEPGTANALANDLYALSGKLKRRLREQASAGDLTQSQMSVLGHLDRNGPTTVTALARMEGVRSQSMGATVAALETAGLERDGFRFGHIRRWRSNWRIRPVRRCRGSGR